MSITLGGVPLISTALHQMPVEEPWENEPVRTSVYGVRGSLGISDERHGRVISIDITFSQYSTEALLQSARETLDALVITLTDKTLLVNGLSSTMTYVHCDLDSVERMPNPLGHRGPWWDGSGVNGWLENLCLHFWQYTSKP
jgi:hypothetical protein